MDPLRIQRLTLPRRFYTASGRTVQDSLDSGAGWRNPETQVVVTRDRLLRTGWEDLDLGDTPWSVHLEDLAESQREDEVLVVPLLHKKAEAMLRGLQVLRDAGIVQPEKPSIFTIGRAPGDQHQSGQQRTVKSGGKRASEASTKRTRKSPSRMGPSRRPKAPPSDGEPYRRRVQAADGATDSARRRHARTLYESGSQAEG